MRVDPLRHDGVMAEPGGHHMDRVPERQHHRSGGVPGIVQLDVGQPCISGVASERVGIPLGSYRLP
jgi:hypothetical protein